MFKQNYQIVRFEQVYSTEEEIYPTYLFICKSKVTNVHSRLLHKSR